MKQKICEIRGKNFKWKRCTNSKKDGVNSEKVVKKT